MKMRQLKKFECIIIERVADKLPVNLRKKLLSDLLRATVAEESDNGARIIFFISDYERPSYRGQHPYPVEGRMLDEDGVEVELILYADENDHLLELELIRWGVGILKAPDLKSLQLY